MMRHRPAGVIASGRERTVSFGRDRTPRQPTITGNPRGRCLPLLSAAPRPLLGFCALYSAAQSTFLGNAAVNLDRFE